LSGGVQRRPTNACTGRSTGDAALAGFAPVKRDVGREEITSGSHPVPTVLRSGPYRFFFYASDRDEKQHVHVERDDSIAKFWLDPIRLQSSGGFSRVEIVRIERLVNDHRLELVEAWNEYFGH
jgi:hypothetical protein